MRPACSRRAAVRFYLSHGLLQVCEINRIHHWCSVVPEKSKPEGPLNGGPSGWDFSGTTEHQLSILFLIYHDRTVQYCVISVGDVTEVDVTVNDARCTNQLETATINSALNNEQMVITSKWIYKN